VLEDAPHAAEDVELGALGVELHEVRPDPPAQQVVVEGDAGYRVRLAPEQPALVGRDPGAVVDGGQG
jgi:hypothetical protein